MLLVVMLCLAHKNPDRPPSIDAIRIELGNTGSKDTISRYIKEIEADEGGAAPPQASISTELQAIVATLAARLELEGQERLDLLRKQWDGRPHP